jgi:ribosome-binding factor A
MPGIKFYLDYGIDTGMQIRKVIEKGKKDFE